MGAHHSTLLPVIITLASAAASSTSRDVLLGIRRRPTMMAGMASAARIIQSSELDNVIIAVDQQSDTEWLPRARHSSPLGFDATMFVSYADSIQCIPRGGGEVTEQHGKSAKKDNDNIIAEAPEPLFSQGVLGERTSNSIADKRIEGNSRRLPTRWLKNVARNLIGRTASMISLRPRRKQQLHQQLNDGDNELVDHSFDELDRILENSNTTLHEDSSTGNMENVQVINKDDWLETWPPLPQKTSLLKGWRKQRSLGSWINKMEQKYLSSETAKALTTIRDIIDSFPDYGVVDLFGMYSPKEVILSIVALSRLQHILGSDFQGNSKNHKSNNQSNSNSTINKDLLEDLAHYCVFANAAYGWKGLAFCGRWHLGGNSRILIRSTGIDKQDLVTANWHSKANRPAYYIARDRKRKAIVMGIRGSLSPRDILTDLCASSENFIVEDDPEIGDIFGEKKDNNSSCTSTMMGTPPIIVGRAHKGMVDAARSVARMTGKTISDELEAHPDYSLVIVGHSLGGGVAAVIAAMWQRRFMGRILSFGYGAPCVFPLNVTGEFDNIVSIVGKGDPFSTISLGHLADATKAISKLCQDKGLRDEILKRAGGVGLLMNPSKGMQREDYDWCVNAMTFLRKQMDSEKLIPPGKIYHLSGPLFEFQTEGNVSVGLGGDTAVLKPVDAIVFNELKLHARMFDVSLHIPVRYEMLLRRLASAGT